jgi:hypothetical protein
MVRFQYVEGLTQIEDFFWNSVNIGLWSSIEAGAAIMAGCAATLRPLVRRMLARAGTTASKPASPEGLSKSQSNCLSGASSQPRNDSAALTTTTSGHDSARSISDKPGFLKSLLAPGKESIELTSQGGHERESQERILDEEAALGLPAAAPAPAPAPASGGGEGDEGDKGDESDKKAAQCGTRLRTGGKKMAQRHSSPGALNLGRR